MFRLNRNERSHWSGNGVHVESELVFMIGRNMHRSLDVGETVLRRWVQQLQSERTGTTPISKALTPEQQKIQELEARINQLEREKDILKKATALLMADEFTRTR